MNLIYFSGPHGSGKTTLMNELSKETEQFWIPKLYSRNIKFHTAPVYRQLLKIMGRALENYEYLDLAKTNPEKIVLANRCIYDVISYNESFFNRGWISQRDYILHSLYAYDMFRDYNKEPYAIVLNPGFDVVSRHLKHRWQESGKKWQEQDMEYARLTCDAYERWKGNKRIYYIDKEIDLESRIEIKAAKEWILNTCKEEKLKEVACMNGVVEEEHSFM